jgi:hypothetical protein
MGDLRRITTERIRLHEHVELDAVIGRLILEVSFRRVGYRAPRRAALLFGWVGDRTDTRTVRRTYPLVKLSPGRSGVMLKYLRDRTQNVAA